MPAAASCTLLPLANAMPFVCSQPRFQVLPVGNDGRSR